MNVTNKAAAVKVGIARADHNEPIGQVSNNAEIQRAAEAARTQRLKELENAKRKAAN